jgi:hypothetical protein
MYPINHTWCIFKYYFHKLDKINAWWGIRICMLSWRATVPGCVSVQHKLKSNYVFPSKSSTYQKLVGYMAQYRPHYLLTPWHYSPDGHKPPLIRFHSLIFLVYFEEQVANLLPQHRFESAWLNNQSHLVAKQKNITGEKQVRKFGRQSISLMLCRVLLHAVNLRHGTDGFTFPPKEVRAKDFYHP